MRLLFLTPYTPTPIRTRPYNLLRGLARRGHDVTLATVWETKHEAAALDQLRSEGIDVLAARLTEFRSAWNCTLALPGALPLQAVYSWQPELWDLIRSTWGGSPGPFDVVHVEHLRGARYALRVKESLGHIPIVWDSVDCISHLFDQAARASRSPFGRLVTRLELGRTRCYESRLTREFDRVLVTSPVDKGALVQLATEESGNNGVSQRISVLPNGVDLDYFLPSEQRREPHSLVFSGKMSYHANVTAALHLVTDIMPLIWAERPAVRVYIVGKDPARAIKRLADRHPQKVCVTGTVPDIRPYLARAAVAICPIEYGAGIQNKVLEAMAMGTPVVASPQAVGALEARDQKDLLVADRPASFAQAVLRLLEDAECQREIGKAGRKYVERFHDWNDMVVRLEAVYLSVMGGQRLGGIEEQAPLRLAQEA